MAPYNLTVASSGGAGEVWFEASDLGPLVAIPDPAAQAEAHFRYSVGVSTSLLAVGAPGVNDVYVYNEPNGTLLHQLTGVGGFG